MDTELLTVSQTAQYLQLSEKTIRRMIGNGSLPASKLGNRTWRIRACDVDEYVSNSCQNKPAYSITNLPAGEAAGRFLYVSVSSAVRRRR